MFSFSIFFTLATLLSIDLSQELDCNYNFGEYGTSFDLSPLILTQGNQIDYYTVHDSEVEEDNPLNYQNFTYFFNICNKVLRKPHISDTINVNYCYNYSTPWLSDTNVKSKYCSNFSSDGTSCNQFDYIFNDRNDLAYGYQILNKNKNLLTKECYAITGAKTLSDDVEETDIIEYSLLDELDPSQGITLTYKGGEWCDPAKINREFRLHFECEDNMYNVPDRERIDEIDTCIYELTIKSIYGCPSECGVFNGQLCGGNGLCDYDFTNNKSRCFCYYGYTGGACDKEVKEKSYGSASPDPALLDASLTRYMHTFYEDIPSSIENGEAQDKFAITYDLHYWATENENYWLIIDTDNKYEYRWNFFDNVDPLALPSSCNKSIAHCNVAQNPDCTDLGYVENMEGSVWQITSDESFCELVGSKSTEVTGWSYYDENDVTGGVSVTFKEGGYCSTAKHNREFTINFICPDTNTEMIDPEDYNDHIIETYVREGSEENICFYSMDIESTLACPYECQYTDIENNRIGVCNGRGVCAGDPYLGYVRCICDEGYTGQMCEKEGTSIKSSNGNNNNDGQGALVTGMVIVSIIFIVAAMVGVYFYYQNRKLHKMYGTRLINNEDSRDDSINSNDDHLTKVDHVDDVDDVSDQMFTAQLNKQTESIEDGETNNNERSVSKTASKSQEQIEEEL